MIETNEKTCLTCGIQLRGRRDKKFCTDQCRSAHYNRINHGSSHALRHVNTVLRKNWRILHELTTESVNSVTEDALRIRGFDFNYFTSIKESRDGSALYYCYDLGYVRAARDHYMLVDRTT